jgi:hypothetical protein
MTAKIIIERRVPENKVKELSPLLKQMRNACMNQPGIFRRDFNKL